MAGTEGGGHGGPMLATSESCARWVPTRARGPFAPALTADGACPPKAVSRLRSPPHSKVSPATLLPRRGDAEREGALTFSSCTPFARAHLSFLHAGRALKEGRFDTALSTRTLPADSSQTRGRRVPSRIPMTLPPRLRQGWQQRGETAARRRYQTAAPCSLLLAPAIN